MAKKLIVTAIIIIAIGGGVAAYLILSKPALPPGFAGGNGRLEAKQVDIATKYPGRIKTVLADEGDTVNAGQIVATMDTEPLEAQLREAQAKIREAQDNRRTAQAEVSVKQSELAYAEKEYKRSKELVVRVNRKRTSTWPGWRSLVPRCLAPKPRRSGHSPQSMAPRLKPKD
jgi:HlyD family secretion protein